MPSTTHPDAFHFERPVPSYWEASADPPGFQAPPLTGTEKTEVAIIGAGYTGLSAAIRLAGDHGMAVTVLDAAEPGWGASGRNGGFCGLGGFILPWRTIIARFGIEDARRFHDFQVEAIDLVRQTCRSARIDAWIHEAGEVLLAHKPNRVAELEAEHRFLHETFRLDGELLAVDALKERGLWAPGFHGGLLHRQGFSIHPLNYARGLARLALEKGAKLHGRSAVVRWERSATGHRLMTAGGGVLEASHVLVATNGFTPEDVLPSHEGRLMPALSSILVTRPLTEAERSRQGWTSRVMAYDSRHLLHYFRLLPDGRFLFGGRGGTDASDGSLGALERRLRRNFEHLFPDWAGVEHTHFWRGLVCLAYDLVPYVGPIDGMERAWTAIAYHGSGVALASHSGKAVADLIAGRPEQARLPKVISNRLAPFPFHALRPLYLRGAYLWYDIQDNWL